MKRQSVVFQQVVVQLGIPDSFVEQLIEAQIIELPGELVAETVVERIRVSWSLHHELGVNLEGVEVALHLLERLQDERRSLAEALAEARTPSGGITGR